ncbi:hypothetical protein [Pseudoduganella sp. HUAS MS19]
MKRSPLAQRLTVVLFLISASGSTVSAGLSKQEICRTVEKHKETATFLTEQGDKFVTDLQLGAFDFSDRNGGDFITSKIKYRLIIRPRSIQLKEECSLATCTEPVSVPPTCPGSREYLVTFAVNPRKFVAGDFDMTIDLRLFDSKYEAWVHDSSPLSPERKIYGKFHMPWAELLKPKSNSGEVADLVHGKRRTVELELVNNGNLPLRLRDWDREYVEDETITLDAAGCKNIALDPGSTCKVTLRNESGKEAKIKYISWKSSSSDENAIVSLYLAPKPNGMVDYNVKNN